MKPTVRLEVPRSPHLNTALRRALAELPPGAIIETGTYKGTGSTRAILDALAEVPSCRPAAFHTIEISSSLIAEARRNLADHPWIDFVHGLTVRRQDAVDFINNDPLIHELDPALDIFVDFLPNPAAGYLAELEGAVGGGAQAETTAPEDVLRPLLARHRRSQPLICLDSAGGLGWLEFQLVLKEMGTQPFLLFLDDINHVKHYRSGRRVMAAMDFSLIDCDPEEGWMVARHFGPGIL